MISNNPLDINNKENNAKIMASNQEGSRIMASGLLGLILILTEYRFERRPVINSAV